MPLSSSQTPSVTADVASSFELNEPNPQPVSLQSKEIRILNKRCLKSSSVESLVIILFFNCAATAGKWHLQFGSCNLRRTSSCSSFCFSFCKHDSFKQPIFGRHRLQYPGAGTGARATTYCSGKSWFGCVLNNKLCSWWFLANDFCLSLFK